MGCRIIRGTEAGTDREVAVLFDSVTGWAFGPVFDLEAKAETFIAWLESSGIDPRVLSPAALVGTWNSFLLALGNIKSVILSCVETEIKTSDDGITVEMAIGVILKAVVLGNENRVYLESVSLSRQDRTLTIDCERWDNPEWRVIWGHAEQMIDGILKATKEQS